MYPENSAVSTKPGMNPAREHLDDRDLGGHRVHHHDDRGAQQDASVPAAASEPRQVFSS